MFNLLLNMMVVPTATSVENAARVDGWIKVEGQASWICPRTNHPRGHSPATNEEMPRRGQKSTCRCVLTCLHGARRTRRRTKGECAVNGRVKNQTSAGVSTLKVTKSERSLTCRMV